MRRLATICMVLLTGCPTPVSPPMDSGLPDGSMTDSSMPLDAEPPRDSGEPSVSELRLRFRLRLEGEVVDAAGRLDLPDGRLSRYDLGVASLVFESDRPSDPERSSVGRLSLLTGPRALRVTPAPPGLYSGVRLALAAGPWGDALDLRVEASEPYALSAEGPLEIELRCEESPVELGVGERVELPVYADVDDLRSLSGEELEGALMARFTLACDEARTY